MENNYKTVKGDQRLNSKGFPAVNVAVRNDYQNKHVRSKGWVMLLVMKYMEGVFMYGYKKRKISERIEGTGKAKVGKE